MKTLRFIILFMAVFAMCHLASAQTKVSKIQFDDEVITFNYDSQGRLTGATETTKSGKDVFSFTYPAANKMTITEQTFIFLGSGDTHSGSPNTSKVTLFPTENKMTESDGDEAFYLLDKNGFSLNSEMRESYTWKKDCLSKVVKYGGNGWRQEFTFKYDSMSFNRNMYSVNWISYIFNKYHSPEFTSYWWQNAFWPFDKLPSKISVKTTSGNNFDLIFQYFPVKVDGRPGFHIEIKTDVDGKMTNRANAYVVF